MPRLVPGAWSLDAWSLLRELAANHRTRRTTAHQRRVWRAAKRCKRREVADRLEQRRLARAVVTNEHVDAGIGFEPQRFITAVVGDFDPGEAHAPSLVPRPGHYRRTGINR